mgnify:CR=1 FL=1
MKGFDGDLLRSLALAAYSVGASALISYVMGEVARYLVGFL